MEDICPLCQKELSQIDPFSSMFGGFDNVCSGCNSYFLITKGKIVWARIEIDYKHAILINYSQQKTSLFVPWVGTTIFEINHVFNLPPKELFNKLQILITLK